MREYIERKEISKLANKLKSEFAPLHRLVIDAFIYGINNNIPSADVVEVVKCKDCVHYEPHQKPVEDFDGRCFARSCETDECDFCNYGKKKENN